VGRVAGLLGARLTVAEDGGEKTEAASARRLQQARGEGNVPLSRDLAGLASFGVGLAALSLAGPADASRLAVSLRYFFAAISDPELPSQAALSRAGALMIQAVAPVVLAVMLAGLAATWLQTGFLFHLGAIRLDLARLSPAQGFGRIFNSSHAVDLLKSMVKLAVLGFAAGRTLLAEAPALGSTLLLSPQDLLHRLIKDFARIVLAMVLAQGVIVAADLLWVRLKHRRDLRMTREDMKQEQKDVDGDPRIKAKRKRIRFMRIRRRMMASVSAATVVVTNPTHYAVALLYERGKQSAPRVVAKGMDEVAANIRAIAEQHRVPLVRNPVLARALYLVEIDAEISSEHFQAVAEIIAYVWRLKTAFRSGAS